MIARTWEYGTEINAKVEKIVTNHPHTVVLTDEHGEGHILIGTSCVRAGICEGDEVTLVFIKGGPTGGYWKIKPVIEWTPCPKCGYPLNDCCCS